MQNSPTECSWETCYKVFFLTGSKVWNNGLYWNWKNCLEWMQYYSQPSKLNVGTCGFDMKRRQILFVLWYGNCGLYIAVLTFCSIFNHILPASRLTLGCDYSVFKVMMPVFLYVNTYYNACKKVVWHSRNIHWTGGLELAISIPGCSIVTCQSHMPLCT